MPKGQIFAQGRAVIPMTSVGTIYTSPFTVIDCPLVTIADSYYSLYTYGDTSQGYVDPLRSSSQTPNRARQRYTDEEGMSWTYPPAFPSRDGSASGHGVHQNEEPHHQVFPASTVGYRIPTLVTAIYADTYTTDGFTEYHSVYQAEQAVQQLPVVLTELASGGSFEAVDIYADLAIDPSLDAAEAVSDAPPIQSNVPTDEKSGVEYPEVDMSVIADEEPEEVVEELIEMPAIEVGFIFPAVCDLGGLLRL
jgi:hypothetical protein